MATGINFSTNGGRTAHGLERFWVRILVGFSGFVVGTDAYGFLHLPLFRQSA